MRAFSTSSRLTSTWYCDRGFRVECRWFFTATLAHCACVVPSRRMCSIPAWPNTAGMRPLPSTPSVRTPEPPLPPRSPIFPIYSTPTASATSCSPAATASHASRKAVEPVAQALATLTTGMPVWPTCCRMRCPTIAFAWTSEPAARSSPSRRASPADALARPRRRAPAAREPSPEEDGAASGAALPGKVRPAIRRQAQEGDDRPPAGSLAHGPPQVWESGPHATPAVFVHTGPQELMFVSKQYPGCGNGGEGSGHWQQLAPTCFMAPQVPFVPSQTSREGWSVPLRRRHAASASAGSASKQAPTAWQQRDDTAGNVVVVAVATHLQSTQCCPAPQPV